MNIQETHLCHLDYEDDEWKMAKSLDCEEIGKAFRYICANDEQDAIEEYDKIWPPYYLTFGQAFDPCKEIVKWMMPSLMETKTMMKKITLNEFDQ